MEDFTHYIALFMATISHSVTQQRAADAMKECKDQASVLTTLTLNRPSLQTGDCELNLSGSQTSPSLHVNKLYVKKFIYAGHKLLNEARNV